MPSPNPSGPSGIANAVSLPNPALDAFIASIPPEKIWAQVLIQVADGTFTLRHLADRDLPSAELKTVSIPDLRKLAMFNAAGQFRPLRSAPDLSRGWIFTCNPAAELWRALQELYPGSIPDWFAAQSATPPVTNYRDFTNRQTGMYRISQLLTDDQAAAAIRACCHPRFCLKHRRWSVQGLEPDSAETKSSIPCLEPCAVLLELARKTARIEQEEKLDVQLTGSELESLLAATEAALQNNIFTERTGNIGSSSNPRRLQLLLEKFKKVSAKDGNEEKI